MEITVGQALIRSLIPPDVYKEEELSAKSIKRLYTELAQKHPDKFAEITRRLGALGADLTYRSGYGSLLWRDLAPTYELDNLRREIDLNVEQILSDPKLTDEEKGRRIIDFLSKYDDLFLDKTKEIVKNRGSTFNAQMSSGARGKVVDLRRLLSGDMIYIDHRNRPIPAPVTRGFVQGLTPAQYWLSTYGARQGWVVTNLGTADAGYLSKQLTNASHQLVVVDIDGPDSSPLPRGLPVSIDDPENIGAFLAVDVDGFRKNTPITPEMLAALKNKGFEKILIRSVLVRRAPSGGVYARDVGLFENGRLFSPGELVGIIAAQSIGEPVTQMVIGAKHSGGTKRTAVDITTLIQLLQVPKIYKGAAHATVTGKVTKIEPAPAGGNFVYIEDTPHFVPVGNDVLPKIGDFVEEGDQISSGLPNPSKIVQYKGLGEGRRYYVEQLQDVYQKTGFNIRRRNFEILVAGLLDHVRITQPFGNYLPGEVIKYSWLEHRWEPREGSQWVPVEKAVGKYLEVPVLHHTIGTKVLPSMAKSLREFGIESVLVHDDPPPFEFYMSPAAKVLDYDPDWLIRFLGGTLGLKRSLVQAVQEGQVSKLRGPSFVPSLATGIGFGTEWPAKIGR